jgi:hypothetical protein
MKPYQQKGRVKMNTNNLTYTEVNGYMVPDLTLPPQPRGPREGRSLRGVDTEGELTRWGRARLNYLREHKPLVHMHMMTQCTLWPHLLEIQDTAAARLDLLTTQMAQTQGVTEELKARDQMLWLGRMNNIRHSAEESVRQELIYS